MFGHLSQPIEHLVQNSSGLKRHEHPSRSLPPEAAQIRSQQQRQRGWKLYSFHAPALGLNPVWSLAIWSSVCPLDQDVGNRCADGGLVLSQLAAMIQLLPRAFTSAILRDR